MFKKSRIRIVLSIMSVLILLLACTLGIIYYSSYKDVYNQNQSMLERYIESNIQEDNRFDDMPMNKDREFNRFDNDNMFMLSTFYSVKFSSDSEVIAVDNNDTLFSDDDLTNLAKTLIEKEKTQGTSNSLVYRIEKSNDFTLVAFMDNTIVSRSINTLFEYTLIFGSVAIVLIFFLSIYLARRIVKPLEESYKKQKQFISDAGHELKTPVSVIGTNAELLSREMGENQWLSNIQYENNRMGVLIKQLMELAKTDSVTPKMEKVDFSRIVIGELLAFESVAYEKGIELNYDEIEQNVFVCANAGQMSQVVSILIDNAIEHSTNSTVTAKLYVKHSKSVFSVANVGEEIPKEQHQLIFERFYRADFSRNSESNHYGLGLAIAKSIVTAHHGDISVTCKNGLVTFTASIPIGHI